MAEDSPQPLDLTPKDQERITSLCESIEKGLINHYELLGIDAKADARAIKTAYYEMSKYWHPDHFHKKNIGEYRANIEAIFATVNQAYQVLKKKSTRAKYDRELEEKREDERKRRTRSSRAQSRARPRARPRAETTATPQQTPPQQPPPPRQTSPQQAPPRQAPPRQAPPRQAPPRQASPRQAPPRQAPPRQAASDVPPWQAPRPEPEPILAMEAAPEEVIEDHDSATLSQESEVSASKASPSQPKSRSRARRRMAQSSGTPRQARRPQAATRRPRRSRRPSSLSERMLQKARLERQKKMRDAKRFFDEGKKAYKDGNPVAAEASLYLATQNAPRNQEYKTLFEEVQYEARQVKVRQEIGEAETAEGYGAYAKALHHYQKAMEYGEEHDLIPAPIFARTSILLQREDGGAQAAARMMEKAARKDTDNPDYHFRLADLYEAEGLGLRAERERKIAKRLQNQK